eukprot:TRINITY_DN1823_c0_g2_i1.p1 TRINITY_DN1823_c0_g2~~TRINITY_DN1823_c0_g2_i1.p1  ORF type:complete len:391 (+),score=60.75 TRINITY_DN1823_c0_g2_i1:117-1289(+)
MRAAAARESPGAESDLRLQVAVETPQSSSSTGTPLKTSWTPSGTAGQLTGTSPTRSGGQESAFQRSSAEVYASRMRAGILNTIQSVVNANQHLAEQHNRDDPRAGFDCDTIPPVNAIQYGEQLSQLSRSRTVWLLTLTYLNRVSAIGEMVLSEYNVHRLLLVSMFLALKMTGMDKGPVRIMQQVAHAGGVGVDDLCAMEKAYVCLIDWRLAYKTGELASLAEALPQLQVAAAAAAKAAQEEQLLNPVMPIPVVRRLSLRGSLTPQAPLGTPQKSSALAARRRQHGRQVHGERHPRPCPHPPIRPRPPSAQSGSTSPREQFRASCTALSLSSGSLAEEALALMAGRQDSHDSAGARRNQNMWIRSSHTSSTIGTPLTSGTRERSVTFAPGV